MKQLIAFTTGFLTVILIAFIMSPSEFEAPDRECAEPSYTKMGSGWCAGMVVQSDSMFCAGE